VVCLMVAVVREGSRSDAEMVCGLSYLQQAGSPPARGAWIETPMHGVGRVAQDGAPAADGLNFLTLSAEGCNYG
jgi:hypothetical protein